jgi:glucan phosphoethanolaminetransferase (alkaline phosphatase superfamily)
VSEWFKLGPVALVLAGPLVYSAAFISYFSYAYNLGVRLIVLHTVLMAALSTLGLLSLSLVPLGTRRWRTLLSFATAMLFVALTVIYVTNVFTWSIFQQNVTFDLAARYLYRPRVLAGYVVAITTWVRVVAVVALISVAAALLVRSSLLLRAVDTLRTAAPAARSTLRLAIAGVCLGSIVLASLILWSSPPQMRRALMVREPFISFLGNDLSFHRFSLSRIDLAHGLEGPQARAAYPKGLSFDRRNVVLIVADSIRADHLPLYGYARDTSPFLRKLSTTPGFRQVDMALATCPESTCSISSILTSKTLGSKVPENFALHELLHDQGYDINLILSGDHQLLGLRQVYGDDVTMFFDGTTTTSFAPTDDRLLFEGLDRVPQFDGTPAMFYVHLMSSHGFGVHDERFRRFRPDADTSYFTSFPLAATEKYVNSYDNWIVQADAILEQVLAALRGKGYLERALVVILSDHGEGLGEHGVTGHAVSGRLYQEFLRIPMFFLDEAGATYGNLALATHVDVAPTIVSRLGLPVPASWEGRSLLDPTPKPYSLHYLDLYEMPLYALVQSSGPALFKYLRQFGREELFELAADPGEDRDRVPTDTGMVNEFRQQLSDALVSVQ